MRPADTAWPRIAADRTDKLPMVHSARQRSSGLSANVPCAEGPAETSRLIGSSRLPSAAAVHCCSPATAEKVPAGHGVEAISPGTF